MADYDGAWKDFTDFQLSDLSLFFFPALYELIDWSRGYDCLEQELLELQGNSESGKRIADKVYRVWLKSSGEEVWIVLHLELQSQRDDTLPKRVY